MGFGLRRGEELHRDWLVTFPILQAHPAILQKLLPLANYQRTARIPENYKEAQCPGYYDNTSPFLLVRSDRPKNVRRPMMSHRAP